MNVLAQNAPIYDKYVFSLISYLWPTQPPVLYVAGESVVSSGENRPEHEADLSPM
jgi:hypothetical protein